MYDSRNPWVYLGMKHGDICSRQNCSRSLTAEQRSVVVLNSFVKHDVHASDLAGQVLRVAQRARVGVIIVLRAQQSGVLEVATHTHCTT